MRRGAWRLGLIVCVAGALGPVGCRRTSTATSQPTAGPGADADLGTALSLGRIEAVDQAIWQLTGAQGDRAEQLRAQLRKALVRSDTSDRVDMLATWWQTNRARIGRGRLAFQGLRAYAYLTEMCGFGPRPSGSEGLAALQAFLEAWFAKRGARVRRQAFRYKDPATGQAVPIVNLIVSLGPDTPRRLIVGTHIDTRRWADEEPDPLRRTGAVIGANDGASGAAVLLELAEILIQHPPRVSVDLVFFDGEEYAPKGSADYYLGSKHFADAFKRSHERPPYAAAAIVDMVGGKRLRVKREPNSVRHAGMLVEEIWQCAADLGHDAFVSGVGEPVDDDHTALNAVGIPSVLLIDFTYPHRHRTTDVPGRCDPRGLRAVGQVLTRWIYRQPRPI